MKRVLISTLGESPGVVTEAIDWLKSRGITLDKVIILSTEDIDAQDSMNLLLDHIPRHYGIDYGDIQPYYVEGAYQDIDSLEAVVRFLERACTLLRSNKGQEVYVSIAGGRKTMSAVMTLAVQLYGAKELFHIILDDKELEARGHIKSLKHLDPDNQTNILHPEISKVKPVLIPFIGLFPLIGDIVRALQSEEAPQEIKALLTESGLLEGKSPTRMGQIVLRILEDIESTPAPCLQQPVIRLANHGFLKEREDMARQLIRRFNFICEVKDSPWKEGQPKVKQVPPEKLEVYFRSRKGFSLALILTTTAKTEGQLRKAAHLVEEFLGLSR